MQVQLLFQDIALSLRSGGEFSKYKSKLNNRFLDYRFDSVNYIDHYQK